MLLRPENEPHRLVEVLSSAYTQVVSKAGALEKQQGVLVAVDGCLAWEKAVAGSQSRRSQLEEGLLRKMCLFQAVGRLGHVSHALCVSESNHCIVLHTLQNHSTRGSLGISCPGCCWCPLSSCDNRGRGLHTLGSRSNRDTRCTYPALQLEVVQHAGHGKERCGRMKLAGRGME